MALDTKAAEPSANCWNTVAALLAADGCATNDVVRALVQPPIVARDLADAVHLVCMLHGRHPGLIDHAANRNAGGEIGWLVDAQHGFTQERAFLARLTSAAGPLPSTPGQAESESAVIAQRHALDMLAQSDRAGCAVGAAVALVLDWAGVRQVLDVAAQRFGLEPTRSALPDPVTTAAFVNDYAATPALERAVAFGAQQMLAQQRGLWHLLDARRSARDGN